MGHDDSINLSLAPGIQKSILELNWLGMGRSQCRKRDNGSEIHRIKVDGADDFAILTTANAGIIVQDLTDGEVLWKLPEVSGIICPGP